MREQLGKKFQIVDEPEPGLMRLAVALTDTKESTPAPRIVSLIVDERIEQILRVPGHFLC